MDISYLTLEQLRGRLTALPFRLPIVVVSESGAARWGFFSSLARLHGEGRIVWFARPDPNPTQETLFRALCALRGPAADGIVAIGGGSAIDLAKAVGAFYSMPGIDSSLSLSRAIAGKAYLGNSRNALPVIAVPTTAGTGSEVTQWATIWDADDNAKHSVDAPWLKPAQAWAVPELLASLPPKVMLAAGLDAVSQAAEAYWAKAGNPLSKSLSVRALQLMTSSLKPGLDDPGDAGVLNDLCTGSLLAGLAFSITRTTACHSISYPLTYMFGMEHGFAAAVTLAQVAEVNARECDISDVLQVFSPYGGMQKWLDSACEGIVALRLSSFGIDRHDIDGIAANSFSAGRMDNNPVDLSVDMVKDVLCSVL